MGRVAFQALKLQAAAAEEPITLEAAKAHLRIRGSDTTQDTYIESTLIPTARKVAEDFQHRAYISQTWDLYLDGFPSCGYIEIPRPPLQSVTSIVYTLEDGSTATVDSASYAVDAVSEPGRIILKDGETWPSDALLVGPSVKVRFVAGYGAAGSSVPAEILRAIYLLIGHYMDNREVMLTGTIGMPIPMAAETLLMSDRFFG